MVQKVLPLRGYKAKLPLAPEMVGAVGVRCEDNIVTFRFLEDGSTWGQSARQISLDRNLAEQLSRLLVDELEDYA